MSGNLIRTVIRALDSAARAAGRDNPEKQPGHLLTGRSGEDEAYFYLRRVGYVIVARNWRSPRHRGELDLVGWDGNVLCFIEVKTRTTRDVKAAEAAVDEEKRHDIGAVARDYRRRVPGTPAVRFDVVSVYYDGAQNSPEITLFKNAFPMP